MRFFIGFFSPGSMREQKETAIARRILFAFTSIGINFYMSVTTLGTEASLFV